jgi:general secretion pathway protein J
MIMPNGPPANSAGFTLIELMVSLALFALISVAGVSLIETMVGVEQRLNGRTERLAEMQRALFLIAADFEQLTIGPARDASGVSLSRASLDGDYSVAYQLSNGALHRVQAGTDRTILSDVKMLEWRFLTPAGWSAQPATKEMPQRPRGVEVTLQLAPRQRSAGGTLRRVITLPVESSQ